MSRLPGGDFWSGHVFEYAFVNSSMKEDAFDSADVSMRLRGVEEALEAWEGVRVVGLGVSVEFVCFSPAILGR